MKDQEISKICTFKPKIKVLSKYLNSNKKSKKVFDKLHTEAKMRDENKERLK